MTQRVGSTNSLLHNATKEQECSTRLQRLRKTLDQDLAVETDPNSMSLTRVMKDLLSDNGTNKHSTYPL